ncbi:hypothetical protein [Corynebacterium sp. ACRPO]|uniref:hypothetical protein n=1 Tax=Corynebacterium sp. ACRPO TaxID=2918200 RepID=UPI001EF643D9|nr:hypothetical protein [Corynebacterium sp. ACRPO]MCG7445769.1 hypothetical protein [Corynebacterium sp. ACRPO]
MDLHSSVRNFIRNEIISPELAFNEVPTTTSAIKKIVADFNKLGWDTRVLDPEGKPLRHEFSCTNTNEVLKMTGPKVFHHSIRTEQICQRKHLTKKLLELSHVAVPVGADFTKGEYKAATGYFEMMDSPAVVKPTNSGGSAGVTINVQTPEEFTRAWKFAKESGTNDSNILVEEFVTGVELRAMVIGHEAVSIVARVQPYVVGDGSSKISELIRAVNEERSKHRRAVQMPIRLDWDFIGKQGHQENSTPDKDEIVLLNPLPLPAQGALTVDVTAAASPVIKNLAETAVKAIPELEYGGVDILVDDIRNATKPVVLEVNTAPSPNLHRYPTHGDSREVLDDIVNHFHQTYGI